MKSFNYGGQAVIEGVMMRGEHECAVCVRNPSGELLVHRESLPQAIYRNRVMRWPFFRGLTMLWDSLGLGLRSLLWSADVAMTGVQDKNGEAVRFTGPMAWTAVASSLAIGVGLFFLLPMLLVSLLDRHIVSAVWSNLAEGVIRMGIFLGYLYAVSFMPDIRRVFAYHGAEHKTINAYEHGAALEPAEVSKYTRAHTRCGTGFLLIVLVIFVFVATLMGRPPFLLRILSRVVLIPIVAGISYEILKLTSKYYDKSLIIRILLAPGLALQRLTTREPDEKMLQVSIQALKEILYSEAVLKEPQVSPPVSQSEATPQLANL
jgi:uncharacterized protein YqhQ